MKSSMCVSCEWFIPLAGGASFFLGTGTGFFSSGTGFFGTTGTSKIAIRCENIVEDTNVKSTRVSPTLASKRVLGGQCQ